MLTAPMRSSAALCALHNAQNVVFPPIFGCNMCPLLNCPHHCPQHPQVRTQVRPLRSLQNYSVELFSHLSFCSPDPALSSCSGFCSASSRACTSCPPKAYPTCCGHACTSAAGPARSGCCCWCRCDMYCLCRLHAIILLYVHAVGVRFRCRPSHEWMLLLVQQAARAVLL